MDLDTRQTSEPIIIKSESLMQGYIEIMADGCVNIHLFDTLDFAYPDAKIITFEKIIEHKQNPDRPAEDEADICSAVDLTREKFIKEISTLDITTARINGELVDKSSFRIV